MPRKYVSLFERLVANTHEPENPQSCWLWKGTVDKDGYPRLAMRVADRRHPIVVRGHRKMLEIVLEGIFPFDEAGHLCYVRGCINPDHLELQSPLFNLADRRGYKPAEGCMIPTLFPVEDRLQKMADWAWDNPGEPGGAEPPF